MFDINKLANKKKRIENRMALFFNLLKKIKTKEEKRELEEKLLVPVPLPIYIGNQPGLTSMQKKSLILVFKKEKDIKRFGKFITINPYINNNCYRLELFLELLNLLEKKILIWNSTTNKLKLSKKYKDLSTRKRKGKINV